LSSLGIIRTAESLNYSTLEVIRPPFSDGADGNYIVHGVDSVHPPSLQLRDRKPPFIALSGVKRWRNG
jgi:hypothetical protein